MAEPRARPIEGPAPATALTGRCATTNGPPSCLPVTSAIAVPPAPATPTLPTPPVATEDIAARLTVIDRDLGDAATRLAAQRTAATSAAATARGTATNSEAWAKAQLELTAFNRVGNQLGDIRVRLDAIAGTLAAANAGGTDVAAALTATGRLIARTMALQADYDSAAAALR